MKKQFSKVLVFVMVLMLLFTSYSMAADVYTVKSGDVLWKIAFDHNTTAQKLADINNLENPDLIFPDQILKLSDDASADSNKENEPEPVATGKTIQILHTNDMHGFFLEGKYDGMGAAKLKTLLDQKKAENPNTLVLDAGDAMQGSNLVTLSKGEKATVVMNKMGFDAMVAGNHEFDYGLEILAGNDKLLNFPMLAANVTDADGKNILKDYIVKEIDGVKIGIIGLATPETTFKSHPDNTKGLVFEDPAITTKRLVKKLRDEEGVALVVAVAHLGETGEWPAAESAEVGGVDVIVDGHSHVFYEQGKLVGDTLIVSTGEHTKNLGVVTIELDKDNKVVSKKAELITKEMAKDVVPNQEIADIINEIVEENKVIEEEVVAKTEIELNGERGFVRTGETNLGNILTAALKDVAKSDLALTNGGGIRTSIDVGDITKGEVLKVLPFSNTVRVIELTGADVKAAIENGIADYPKTKGAFPHIAGMTVTFDSSKKAGERVVSLKVDGKDIDLEKTYTLATNDFLVAGGDGYEMFKGKNVVGEYNAMDQVFIDYIAKNGTDAGKLTGRMKEINDVKPDLSEH